MDRAEIVLHQVSIPIRALRFASVYEIIGDSESILIDAGMNLEGATEVIQKLRQKDSIDLLAITHLHIDHVGGAIEMQRALSCDIAMGEPDFLLMDKIATDPDTYARDYLKIATCHGFPMSLAENLRKGLPFLAESAHYSDLQVKRKLTGTGNLIDGIDYDLMPGHSPGSTVFMMQKTKTLFSGDHILPRITPNISFYGAEMDMLGMYLKSLEKTRELEMKMCYPGHGEPFAAVTERIDQLIKHHEVRIAEIGEIVAGWKTAYEVASEMKWNRNRMLSSMNEMERNFAFSEALAHLIHMERTGSVKVKDDRGVMKFRRET